MSGLWTVPISSVLSLSPEDSIFILRAILRAECAYAKLRPSSLTISNELMIPDGGVDAEILVPREDILPKDCLFQNGVTGFQIKSGASFKPWVTSSMRSELLNSKGMLGSEVERLIDRGGNYTLVCTGHDLTPKQRNDAKELIASVFSEKRVEKFAGCIEVLGASQIVEYAERYPGIVSKLTIDPVQDALTFDEWRQDTHLVNIYEDSLEQANIVAQIRTKLQSEVKHIRLLGDAGLGKTRIVLESVKDETVSPYVLYVEHGTEFGKSTLFRHLLKSGHNKPLILVLDELPERELTEIWRHLKLRCGLLKIISMDHGRDKTHDDDIDRIHVPYLSDDTIKKILAQRIGESQELDRWVEICEGSPRVAQAVADNLCANPTDLLKPPTTVPIWARFIHGYGSREEADARQIDCVAQHLALFSRFGYEAPVGGESKYIAGLVKSIAPTIGWARFQEVVQDLRARRVLQGSRTLFFVPKALHIYLWKQFWMCYGREFDFTPTFSNMPESLHTWFMSMFKYAAEADTAHVIDDILSTQGIFSQSKVLVSRKGSKFLSILAEANPAAVLRFLEATIGNWTNQELMDLKENRQQFVWAIEKIAVWSRYSVRAMHLLIRLALNENTSNYNNATGTLLSLFSIGPEWAVTESSPDLRLSAFLSLLRADSDGERYLGLKVAKASLNTRAMGFRLVGPEYQGLKERAKLWVPETYDVWCQAYLMYFRALVDETQSWPPYLRSEVCNTLLDAVEQQICTPPCTELAFQVLNVLVNDEAMQPERLNNFFFKWREYRDSDECSEITRSIKILEGRYTKRDLVSRFNRYVLDVSWKEWKGYGERGEKDWSRAKTLVTALARRIASSLDRFNEICHLLAPEKCAPGLSFFGMQLAHNDTKRVFLPRLIEIALATKSQTCLYGYLSSLKQIDPDLYITTINAFFDSKSSSWLGVNIVLGSDYDDALFVKCLWVLGNKWVSPQQFIALRYDECIGNVPKERLETLFQQLRLYQSEESIYVLVELLDSIPFNESSAVDSGFVLDVVSKSMTDDFRKDTMKRYYWKNVCQKLIKWDERCVLPLLDLLLNEMKEANFLSYDLDVMTLANELVQTDSSGAWNVIKGHLEESLPKWRRDILDWLKGGVGEFEEKEPRGVIADLPIHNVLEWIDENPEVRAGFIASAAPPTMDDINGGKLTRELLRKYRQFDRVQSGISASFHSGGWVGSRTAYLKRKRDKFHQWLAAGFGYEITHWIEGEIEALDQDIELEEIKEERSQFD